MHGEIVLYNRLNGKSGIYDQWKPSKIFPKENSHNSTDRISHFDLSSNCHFSCEKMRKFCLEMIIVHVNEALVLAPVCSVEMLAWYARLHEAKPALVTKIRLIA